MRFVMKEKKQVVVHPQSNHILLQMPARPRYLRDSEWKSRL